ncbi:MAG: tol-pal system-associated acyl-CoA thioesterase [Alphaproteobacteria bacterium]|nr:tol-pal system-associated acyl-CoA thioesterase [Alphaproteobacteria bacterium]
MMSPREASHKTDIRVYYEDTDAGGIVYYANYLKFAERGRTEFLRDLGFGHRDLQASDGVGFVVRRCIVDYLKPAQLDDALIVESDLLGVSGARFEMAQRVLRNATILCELTVTLGCVDELGKPVRLPQSVRKALEDWGLVSVRSS